MDGALYNLDMQLMYVTSADLLSIHYARQMLLLGYVRRHQEKHARSLILNLLLRGSHATGLKLIHIDIMSVRLSCKSSVREPPTYVNMNEPQTRSVTVSLTVVSQV